MLSCCLLPCLPQLDAVLEAHETTRAATMPTPAKLTKDKAAAVALRPETVEFFARVKAFLGQRQESERLYAELCAAAPEAARRARDLGKALAATMPAVSLPPPLEKPRRRRAGLLLLPPRDVVVHLSLIHI